MDILAWREENLAKSLEENNKNLMWSLVWIGEREKSLRTFEKVSWIIQDLTFKKACSRFLIDWKLVSIDQKTDWINRNSKKNRIFEKITWFLKKLLKALNIRNKMHEYEMKCFSKTQVLNPVFPKLRFSNILPLNS